MTTEVSTALVWAKAAYDAEALRIWDRDEHQDCGSCGGAMLQLDSRTKLAKAAVEKGAAYKSGTDVFVLPMPPEGIRSQNADIYQNAMRAFRGVLIEAGYEKAIKKFWTYTD